MPMERNAVRVSSRPTDSSLAGNVTRPVTDPSRLTLDQLQGWACARCGYRLYQSVLIGTVPDGHGVHAGTTELYACPACATPAEREAEAARTAHTPAGWCCYCRQWAANATRITHLPEGTGAGYQQFAHATCAKKHQTPP
ncbi:hypothetical protein GCM10009544_39730 [Streptomyces stramineus]|uniref:Uncharacterized protein n=1 Tax=Streptomyces stramineus TaxID=173861 RepID=A0ABN1ADJ3_9ACTN